jgi:hypothetical protein
MVERSTIEKKVNFPPPEVRVGKISKKGDLRLVFNQEMLVPDFIDLPGKNKPTKGRELVEPSELNVARDLVDIKIVI